MRLWTLHPKYLDARVLLHYGGKRCWLKRFLKDKHLAINIIPTDTIQQHFLTNGINCILLARSFDESCRRGYCFDESKIASTGNAVAMTVTRGQLDYEVAHLKRNCRLALLPGSSEFKRSNALFPILCFESFQARLRSGKLIHIISYIGTILQKIVCPVNARLNQYPR